MNLTENQKYALTKIENFISNDNDCFLLTGYAGTGKTFLLSEVVRSLKKLKLDFTLLAPTGKSSRVFAKKSDCSVQTVHSAIYRIDDFVDDEKNDDNYFLKFELKTSTTKSNIFLVDEASLISDIKTSNDYLEFGSGRLLCDLIYFTKDKTANKKVKLIFCGDRAQLFPIGSNNTPALSKDYLEKEYNFKVEEIELTEVYRQLVGSNILKTANNIRKNISEKVFNNFQIVVEGDIENWDIKPTHPPNANKDKIIISYSNDSVYYYNQVVRKNIMNYPIDEIVVNEKMLVILNNIKYGFSNGDIIKIKNINQTTETVDVTLKKKKIQLNFLTVDLIFEDSNHYNLKLLINSAFNNERTIPFDEFIALRVDFEKRTGLKMPKKKLKTENYKQYKAIKENYLQTYSNDPYVNALVVKFGYALTCHKAQGSEWDEVYIDFKRIGFSNEDFFRWAYTAITRAKEKLFILNSPSFSWDKFGILDTITNKLINSSFKVLKTELLHYRFRLTISLKEKVSILDFIYNNKGKITVQKLDCENETFQIINNIFVLNSSI